MHNLSDDDKSLEDFEVNVPLPHQAGYDSGQDDDDDDDDSGGGGGQRKTMEEEERKSLMARKEQKAVFCSRIAVYLVVVLTAVIVSVGVYFYAKKQEEDNFKTVFVTNANKLAESFLDSVERKVEAVGGLSTSITNHALSTGQSFPNVTIENWETVADQTRIQADGIVIEWAPLVTDETREGWEEYAFNHQDWVDQMYLAETEYKAAQDAYFGLESIITNDQGGRPPRDEGRPPPPGGGGDFGRPQPPAGQGQAPPPGSNDQGNLPQSEVNGQGGGQTPENSSPEVNESQQTSLPVQTDQGLEEGEESPPDMNGQEQTLQPEQVQDDQGDWEVQNSSRIVNELEQAFQPEPNATGQNPPPSFVLDAGEGTPQPDQAGQWPPPPMDGQGPPPDQDGQWPPPPMNSQPPGRRALQQGQGLGPPPDWPRPPPPKYTREIFGLGRGGPGGQVMPVGSGPYAPLWQMSPILPHQFLLNLNQLTKPIVNETIRAVIAYQKAALSRAEGVADPSNITDEDILLIRLYNDFLHRGQYRHDQGFFAGDPITNLVYPVFNAFGENRTLAGFLQMPLLWRLNFEKVLPEGMDGIVVVMKNNMNQAFSYRIDGPKVTYLGLKDYHSTRYESMFVFQNMGQSLEAMEGPESRTYNAVDLDTDYTWYSLYVYPSEALEDKYITNEPAIFAAVVASIFVFTLIVLAAFDLLVAQRQKIVMKKAVESTALVSTLYPKQVRDRLFEDEPVDLETSRKTRWKTRSALTHSTLGSNSGRRAIAEKWDTSTILFMDLAGFTRWSSSREPEDVFLLLETLYQAFDKIAAKAKVYKIETIGDCWVGVTGVPDTQEDHAPRMAKFAASCQMKMGKVISNKLTDRLGPDTAKLALRVGMHSGPITGGILRGDKGRFQLFGDTINTASRMESNGEPGKIHISSETAEELIKHGCEEWLSIREDQIHAKGKGLMTTYWVIVQNARSTTTKSTTDGFTESEEDVSDMWRTASSSNRLDQSDRFNSSSSRINQSERLHPGRSRMDRSSHSMRTNRLRAIDEFGRPQAAGAADIVTEIEV